MTIRKILLLIALNLLIAPVSKAQESRKVFPGADEKTPSRSEYFSWINNTNEGATTRQTMINLEFFKWLWQEYGMKLDIYAFDAGAIDGSGFYGSIKSSRFKRQFPGGFGPLADFASKTGTRLGIWGGPDGFGDTKEEENQRIETMVSLCRDFHFELFKMDAVCGQLRPEKYDAFDRMMTECRKFSPDLVLLNHRLDLGKGTIHSTTFLMGGAETYIDVHMANQITAPHHRVEALARDLPPGLTRLTEDHGVCLSSCLNYWEDDLILQAFNRDLVLAPELYGNPWLLKDDEYPLLARIFNLHRKYRDILVAGMQLSEKEYGLNAVSRGDDHTRFITLRNLSWQPVSFNVKLDKTVGLKGISNVEVRICHPTERIEGNFPYGSTVKIEVLPFRSCLIQLSDHLKNKEFGIEGTDYQIVKELNGQPSIVSLLGLPGTEKKIKLSGLSASYKSAAIDGEKASALLKGKSITIKFEGDQLNEPYHRKLSDMISCQVPEDAEAIYESTLYAADNNALEARELKRSGKTTIPQVEAARKAFFEQEMFVKRELWDTYMFDNNQSTAFAVNMRWGGFDPDKAALRIDMGKVLKLDSIVILTTDEFTLMPLRSEEGNYALISKDLKAWESVLFYAGKSMKIDLSKSDSTRYLKLQPAPLRVLEVIGYSNGVQVDRTQWRGSNLFRPYIKSSWRNDLVFSAKKAWSMKVKLDQIPAGSYLCIAINGTHGVEGAFAGAKIDGKYVGCPDRAPSFRSNTWEVGVRTSAKNYTYYLPVSKEMAGKEIEVFVLAFNSEQAELKPEVYITSYPAPFEKKVLTLQ